MKTTEMLKAKLIRYRRKAFYTIRAMREGFIPDNPFERERLWREIDTCSLEIRRLNGMSPTPVPAQDKWMDGIMSMVSKASPYVV